MSCKKKPQENTGREFENSAEGRECLEISHEIADLNSRMVPYQVANPLSLEEMIKRDAEIERLTEKKKQLEQRQEQLVQSYDQRTKMMEQDLGARERATLLIIIAALAKEMKIDISKPSKAAEAIDALTSKTGARIAARTIEDHLKRIPDALERRLREN